MDVLYRLGRATASEILGQVPRAPSCPLSGPSSACLKRRATCGTTRRGSATSTARRCPATRRGGRALKHLVDTFFEGSNAKLVAALLGGDAGKVSDEDLGADYGACRCRAKGVAMTLLVDLAVRGSVVLLFGLAVAASQHRRSAAVRHAVLAMAIAASIAVVPLGRLLPSWEIEILPPAADARVSAPSDAAATVVSPISVVGAAFPAASRRWPLLTLLWLAGAAVAGLRLAVGIGRLAWLTRRAAPLERSPLAPRCGDGRERCRVVTARHLASGRGPGDPRDLGLRRPCVLLPRDASRWTDERMLVVLRHELAHVRRHDWIVQLLAEAARAVCWFNPLMWLACARLRREGEHACDDIVLAGGVEAPAYATHLLDLARRYRAARMPWASPVSMARPSTLERRIAAMLNATLNRQGLSTRALLLAAAALAMVAVPVAALRATQGAPLPLTGLVYEPDRRRAARSQADARGRAARQDRGHHRCVRSVPVSAGAVGQVTRSGPRFPVSSRSGRR